MICNGDEGDPGAFMDRSILEGDPHSVIEGMIVAAYAIGDVTEGFIYVRAEYPLAVKNLLIAIAHAEELGLLGRNILGSGLNFHIEIKRGAGAFVCGESTALMYSIEGNRGMPRQTPPRSVERGLWGKPTVLNNVKTFALVPMIVNQGADRFAGIGTERSKGTQVFALTGKVQNTGLVEVPMGITIRELVYEIGGGTLGGGGCKAVQIGGPSGGCIPENLFDTPIDFDSLQEIGAMMGSGGLVVMDKSDCMVAIARYFLAFTQQESCGKCPPCRVGGRALHNILEKITRGEGVIEDLDRLKAIGATMQEASLCGLGQTSPNPILSTLKYFEEEYIEHISDKKCTAKKCKALITFEVIPDACTGCTLCARKCPVNTISGARKEVHFINQDACIKCRECFDVCNFDAILIK